MAYASWPASLPQLPARRQWTGGPQDSRVQFQPEYGPPITRRRTTADVRIYDGAWTQLSTAQRATFEAFYDEDLAGGTQPFVMLDPVTAEVARWRVVGDGSLPYSFVAKGAGWHDLSMRMMRLPGATWFAPYLPAGTLEVPAMVLDFANQVYGIDGVRKAFSDIVTFTRAGSANYVDANGVTQSAGPNEPRFDHDPVSPHAPLGLLMDDTDGDVAWIHAAEWPAGLFASAGTMLVACRSQQVSAATYRNVFAARGAAAGVADSVEVFVRDTTVTFRAFDGGATQANLNHGAYTIGTRVAVAAAFQVNDFRSSRGGAAALSDVAGTMPTVDRGRIGEAEDQVRVEKIVLWNKVLTAAQLQGLSA